MMQQHCEDCQTWSCFRMEGNRNRSIIPEFCNKALGWVQTPLNSTSYLCAEGIGTFINWSGPSRTESRRQVVKIDPRKMGAGGSDSRWSLRQETSQVRKLLGNKTRLGSCGRYHERKQIWLTTCNEGGQTVKLSQSQTSFSQAGLIRLTRVESVTKGKQSDGQRDKAQVLWKWYKEKEKSNKWFQGVSLCPIPTDYECLGLQHESVFFRSNASVFLSFVFISYQRGMRKEKMNGKWQRRRSDGCTGLSCFSGEKWRNFALERKQRNDNCSRLTQIPLSPTKTCCSALADYCGNQSFPSSLKLAKGKLCRGTFAGEAVPSLKIKGLVMLYLMQNTSDVREISFFSCPAIINLDKLGLVDNNQKRLKFSTFPFWQLLQVTCLT